MKNWQLKAILGLLLLLFVSSAILIFFQIRLHQRIDNLSKRIDAHESNHKALVEKVLYELGKEVTQKLKESPPPSPYTEEYFELKKKMEEQKPR